MVVTNTMRKELNAFLLMAYEYGGSIAYDVETDGLHPYKGDRVIGYAFYFPTLRRSYYIPVRHRPHRIVCVGWQWEGYETAKLKKLKHRQVLVETGECREYDLSWEPTETARLLAPIFEKAERTPLFGWNIKFDKHATECEGIRWGRPMADVMLAAHLWNENELTYELKRLGAKYVGDDAREEKDALAEWAKANKVAGYMGHLDRCPLFMVGDYAEQDVVLTDELARYYVAGLKQQGLLGLWHEINRYDEALQRMERWGILVDEPLVRESVDAATARRTELEHTMWAAAGRSFNPGSWQQVADVLKIPKTNKAWLQRVQNHPVTPLLEEWRQWNRAITTYFHPWLALMDADHRVHPSLLLHGTVAGRLSCRLPNFQNLPRQDDRTVYDVRRAIVAAPGHTLVEFDYSQIELRVATHYCQDPDWLDVYRNGGDLHQQTADLVGIRRQDAKTVNFAMLYGMGAPGLSSSLQITLDEAREILDGFRNGRPKLVEFCKRVSKFAYKNRYIELWTGRKRRYPPPHLTKGEDTAHTAVNNMIQGGAAEIIRHAITRLDRLFLDTPVRMILQIHDAILFEMPDEWVEPDTLGLIKRTMEDFRFNVPVVADCKAGKTWATMEKADLGGTDGTIGIERLLGQHGGVFSVTGR